MGALDGIKVLDFGRFIAGPFCAALLGDLGADVLRIERVEGGEDRFLSPVTPDGAGALFLQCNRGKRCLTLDLVSPEGREIVRRLVAEADVVIANLPLRALTALGLDYTSLSAINPRVVAVLLSAWGTGGEWSDRIGFDSLAQATSGAMDLTGPAGEPTRSYVPYVDFSTATLAALGTVAALRHRDLTGKGQLVEGSLFSTAVAWNSSTLIEEALLGIGRTSTHNRSQTAGPSDTFRTRDGWVMVAIVGRGQFGHWCEMVERPDLVDDERFSDDMARGTHGELLTTYMAAWCADRTTAECTTAMETHRIPGGPVLSPAEVLELPHLEQTGLLAHVDYPGMDKEVPLVRAPLRLSVTPTEIRRRPPQLGEHREEVLAEIGYTAQQIAELVAAGVV